MNTRKLIVFSDDWGRHPSSCQHLVRNLLPQVPTTWVNTIGMRPPRLDWLTVTRGAEKIRGWSRPSATNTAATDPWPDGLKVIDTKMWPWMSHRWDRWVNQRLLDRQLCDRARGATAITTLPIVADLVGVLPVERWVYYCVDDFSVWPGLDGRILGQLEDRLIERVDRVIAASESLVDGIKRRGRDATLLTHGVDLDFWATVSASETSWLRAAERPIVLFWGVIDQRMNAPWVLELADQMTEGTIVLAGPQQDPDARLRDHARIRLIGSVPFADLPALAAGAAALIMPYADLPVTRAMQPLKLKEYLATGRPVVVSRLPAIRDWEPYLYVVDEPADFVRMTLGLINQGTNGSPPASPSPGHSLAAENWAAKADRFAELVFA